MQTVLDHTDGLTLRAAIAYNCNSFLQNFKVRHRPIYIFCSKSSSINGFNKLRLCELKTTWGQSFGDDLRFWLVCCDDDSGDDFRFWLSFFFFLLSLRCRDDDSAVSNRQLDKFTTSGTKEIKYYIENLKSSDHSYTGDFQFFELPYSWNSNWCIFLPISLENSKHRLFSLAIRLAFARDMYPFNWQI